jgi:hypothetical protein
VAALISFHGVDRHFVPTGTMRTRRSADEVQTIRRSALETDLIATFVPVRAQSVFSPIH